jgi:hypothetical protein
MLRQDANMEIYEGRIEPVTASGIPTHAVDSSPLPMTGSGVTRVSVSWKAEARGDLSIFANDALTSLSGLGRLTNVLGNLEVQGNGALTSLTGLDSVTSIGGYLNVRGEETLQSLHGLESVTSVGESLQIGRNNSLTSLNPLHSWPSDALQGGIFISSNPALPPCEVDKLDSAQTNAEAQCPADACAANAGVGDCN